MDPNILRPWWQLNGFTRVRRTDLFWRRVKKTRDSSACWPCLNGRSASGYGTVWWHGKTVYAHRLAYELYHDCTVPPHLVVRHHCDNPLCCRPSHLEIGTRFDNSRDMVRRARNVLSRRGPRHPCTAAHPDRRAVRFHVTQKTIWLIVAHKPTVTWRLHDSS